MESTVESACSIRSSALPTSAVSSATWPDASLIFFAAAECARLMVFTPVQRPAGLVDQSARCLQVDAVMIGTSLALKNPMRPCGRQSHAIRPGSSLS